MALQFSQADIDQSIGVLIKMISTDVGSVCAPIAAALNDADSSDQKAQDILEGMKKFQDNHNRAIESINALIAEFRKLPELAEAFKKYDIGTVSAHSTDFDITNKINPVF